MADDSGIDAGRALDLPALATALAMFRIDCRRYPTTDEGLRALLSPPPEPEITDRWRGPYVQDADVLRDFWGRELYYVCPGRHNPFSYDLCSAGPDGQHGSADDICNWRNAPDAGAGST